MRKVMLINVTHVEESRVVILEDGVLAGYEIETTNRSNIIGNIYNVVVENVLPSIEAAFAKLGPDLKGFLPLDEVNFKLLPPRGDGHGKGRISKHLHSGQRLMAQVVRAPFANKPPTITTYFSLPGRYLVLMPGVDTSGISRKIDDAQQRDRLKKVIEELNPPEGFGLIVRTAGVGRTKTELQRDLRYLLRLWESIQRASKDTEFPGLVYQERDLVIRTIRDYFTPDIEEVWIDSKETYERALTFVRDVMPTRAKTIKLYTGDRPLFNKFNLEDQIESIYRRRVTLPSGGEIVIDGTEAMTAIDVNTARAARKGDAEETVLTTNLEAAAEIVRQLRLRDVGGLIVIDFIDMASTRNKMKVEKAVREALKTDKARYDLTRISKLGLMEIARQRLKGEKMGASYLTCPTCDGHGLVRTVESAGLAALRKLQTRGLKPDVGLMRMLLPPEVVNWTLNYKREELLQLERRQSIRISLEPKDSLLRHECEFETVPRERESVEAPPALVGPDRPAPAVPPDLADLSESDKPKAAPPAKTTARVATAPPKAEVAAGEQAEPAKGEGESSETPAAAPKKRRRRRRRRRSPGAQEGQPHPEGQSRQEDRPPDKHSGADPESDGDHVVPRNVKPDELMPAAAGGPRSGRSGSKRRSRSRGRGSPTRE
jgi:ribonuclease E